MDLQPRTNAVWKAIGHGACQNCPRCGEGRLFRSYLKQVEFCTHCCERFGHIRADDGPAWLTVLIIGHIVVGVALLVERNMTLPLWLSVGFFVTLSLVLVLAVLQRAKGMFIGAIWAMGAQDSGPALKRR